MAVRGWWALVIRCCSLVVVVVVGGSVMSKLEEREYAHVRIR